MKTAKLKRFAQYARCSLIDQVSTMLDRVLAKDSPARRENPESVKSLENQIERYTRDQVVERVAYTWFNRFCALRFMDESNYSRMGVVSPANGQFLPEVLAEAKKGHIDKAVVPERVCKKVLAMLKGEMPSNDPQGEAYRLLLVAYMNYWNKFMPFLFQRINDYTELLMPQDLLSGNSILAYTREAMTPNVCRDVEVIGWLYQFYISEKKDKVFADLKRNIKVNPENIPAATQLFTPNWIVRYLVENSLGRLWMLNHPGSRLIERMDYYIRPDQPETDYLRIDTPEEIKICDPACGSGHMLTYAFDLLYAIYEEEGYSPRDIPAMILMNNLYGIEIDERAGEMAAFALTMKAREKQRQFFDKRIKPKICVLEPIRFEQDKLDRYMDFIGRDLFPPSLETTLHQFEDADNLGSLIRPAATDATAVLNVLESKDVRDEVLFRRTHEKVLQVLRQSVYLSDKYHAVITNPPYMGSRNMNGRLAKWLKNNFSDSRSDLFASFIERSLEFVHEAGLVAMITMQSWMFLSSFQAFRQRILMQETILSMAHLGANAFDSIGGHVVMTTAFVLEKKEKPLHQGGYLRLLGGGSENIKSKLMRDAIDNPNYGCLYRASSADFRKIPGNPIAYWAKENSLINVFNTRKTIRDLCEFTGSQHKTGNNDQYLRMHWEVSRVDIGQKSRWVPCAKGGGNRKWFGLLTNVVDWSEEAIEFYKTNPTSNLLAEKHWFRSGITYSKVTSGTNTFRFLPSGCIYDMGGPAFHPLKESQEIFLLGCNTDISDKIFEILNPTLNLQVKDVKNLPIPEFDENQKRQVKKIHNSLVSISQIDWDSTELSLNFRQNRLLDGVDMLAPTFIERLYSDLREQWKNETNTLRKLENESNELFRAAYGLEDDFESEVDSTEITLFGNPAYRYGDDRSKEELEKLLLADTMRELVSYAVGCMFGRYALDKPGLILANQGETIQDYLKAIPEPVFPADENNVIPVLDGNWFRDDIAERFCQFLRIAFGKEHFEDNLRFVEKALNINDRRNFSMRNYFLSEFYADHVKYYKKRPIYWLFSSSRGSFNALVYLHRYRPDTVSVVLNDYVREFQEKLKSQKSQSEAVSISTGSNQGEKTRALKEIEKINRTMLELEEYEREILYPLATRQVSIDLDDGVKVNYRKFGKALKKVHGLSSTKVIQDTIV